MLDIDGDTVELRYDWYVNEVVVQSGSEDFLDGSVYFDKGDEVYVIVTPNDGIDLGVAESSFRVVVDNTLPTIPIISIENTCKIDFDDFIILFY